MRRLFRPGQDGLDERPRPYSAVCLTDAEILKIDASELMEILKARPDVSYAFVTYLIGRNKELRDHLANSLLCAGAKRLAHTLLSHEERFGQLPRLSQQTLAEMIGTTRQYVNVLLKEFSESRPCVPGIDSVKAEVHKENGE